jgi:hypothetical protein
MFTGIALLAGAATLSGQTSQQSQDIDFRNFAYAYSGACRSRFRVDGDRDSGIMPIMIPG